MLKDFITAQERVIFKPYQIGRIIKKMMADEKTKLKNLEDIERVILEQKSRIIESLTILSSKI